MMGDVLFALRSAALCEGAGGAAAVRPTCPGERGTLAEAYVRMARVASSLARVLGSAGGKREGARIAVLASDTREGMELIFAVAMTGRSAALLNRRWSVREMASAANVSRATAVVHDGPHAEAAAHVARRIGGAALAHARLLDEHNDAEEHTPPSAVPRAPSGEAFAIFTSGTTGTPKATRLSHAAVCLQSAAKLLIVGYDDRDVYLHNAPLYHVGGLSSMHAAWCARCAHVFYSGGYSAPACLAELTHPKQAVTAFIAVPAMLVDLLHACDLRDAASATPSSLTFPSLRRILVGGGALSHADDALALRRRAPNARLVAAYGLTEATSSVTFGELRAPPDDAARNGVAVGLPPPGIELAFRRDDGSVAAFAGDAGRGEVLVRGGIAMLGYVGNDAATAAAFHGEWLRTGDVASCDPSTGELRLHGRLSERIRTGGESVEPMEVEAALVTLDAARLEWAVVGVADRRLGQRVCAVYAPRGGGGGGARQGRDDQQPATPPDLDGVAAHCRRAGLAGYKLPRAIVSAKATLGRDHLPRGANGKLLRKVLSREVAAALAEKPPPASKL